MVKFRDTALNNAEFNKCKIMGVIFSECQEFLFSVYFLECKLDYASFMGKKMLKTKFLKCSLKETNFTQTILSGSVFDDSDLSGAIFNRTDLTSTNFYSASNFTIDPESNIIKKAIFSRDGLPGLLQKYQLKII